MRVLGLDLGRRRIGLALSDPKGAIALPAGALQRRDLASDLESLRALVVEREVERIVVGLPIHMNGSRGAEAQAAQSFARALAEATGLPVDTLDERWTTVEAQRALRAAGVKARRQREIVDSVAATILLRTYLARLANRAGPEEPVGS
jgi:putative Holliday junction resolvase